MSLRGEPVELGAVLPDGRDVLIRIGVPDDPYIPRRELHTVDVELSHEGRVLAVVNTVLEPEQRSEALALGRQIAIEPLADELPAA